ncbi:uncharacterized protein N7503_006563 [Penicillium pulvis]|uniref:uncharacterized protein n=1 Tax=Penicillium pulvis TaxID=1562058 RepID=UPI002546E1FD|nr:uncharacterized protein N7503_006563 [Penicillium pulvis]KAJ5797267.1 hypothetical protein N7503_006563 [Penicillium pulvis]
MEENDYIIGFKLVLLLSALTSAALLALIDSSIVAPAIPRITSQFHSLSDVAWYGSAYQLTRFVIDFRSPLTGKLYRYFKTKTTFITLLGIFELSSLICAIASSSEMLIVGRVMAGIGASGIQNGALTIISRSFPPKRQARFYINLPFGGAITLVLIFINIPDPTFTSECLSAVQVIRDKLDLIGFCFFAPAMIQLLLALEYGGNGYSWSSETVIGLFCGSGTTFILFLAWEYRTGTDAIWFVEELFFFAVSSYFLGGGGMTACATYYLPLYFQVVKGVSPMMSGVYLLPNIISQLILVIFAGVLVGKVGCYLPFGIASGILSSIGNGLISLFSLSTSAEAWIGYQVLIGAGRGIGTQAPIIAVQNIVPAADISVALSLLLFSQTLGQAIFLTLSQLIFINRLKSGLAVYAPSVDSGAVVAAGASAIRTILPTSRLAGVLMAFSQGVDHVFYLAVSLAIGCFFVAWGMGWKDIRKRHLIEEI